MLYDKLTNYAKSDIYPFHMPGHKRIAVNNDTILPYKIDLTEINDFDNLHSASGCINDVQEKAKRLYSVNYAYLLVNGATGGILSSIRAMTNKGDKVIVARNCHISVYNAIELCGLNPEYIVPAIAKEFGINSSITPEQVENALIKHKNAKLVVLTSPTYEGVVSDVKSIAEICHKYDAKLFIDEAHGAHFPFSEYFPSEAVKCGADAAVVSLHKTLPSLTQTALLMTNDDVLSKKLQQNLSVFETSSPSYVLMSSMENCLDFICNKKENFNQYIKNLRKFYFKTKSLKKIKILGCENNLKERFYDYDFGKIIISVAETNINGKQLANVLRENYKLETEMAYTNYVIAMTSVCDTKQGFDMLCNALFEIDNTLLKVSKPQEYTSSYLPHKAFISSERFDFESEDVSLESAEGRISLEYVWAYPPGVPLLVPGEVISLETISQFYNLRKDNIDIHSTNDKIQNHISVVKFN